MIGRIAPEKGQLEFVEMARQLPSHWQFIICGAPLFSNPAAMAYFDQVKNAAEGLPIEFTGWRDDIGEVLSQLDLLVIPYAPYEATTRVILEAYAAGVPVIAPNSGGIPEIVVDGETGFLVSSDFVTKISDVMSQPALRSRVAENARQVWKDRFTLDQYQARILSILESVGARARA